MYILVKEGFDFRSIFNLVQHFLVVYYHRGKLGYLVLFYEEVQRN